MQQSNQNPSNPGRRNTYTHLQRVNGPRLRRRSNHQWKPGNQSWMIFHNIWGRMLLEKVFGKSFYQSGGRHHRWLKKRSVHWICQCMPPTNDHGFCPHLHITTPSHISVDKKAVKPSLCPRVKQMSMVITQYTSQRKESNCIQEKQEVERFLSEQQND